MTEDNKHTLWGGPQDGLEVEVKPGDLHYIAKVAVQPGDTPHPVMAGRPKSSWLDALYSLNRETDKYEWVGYQ